ncbi:putative lysosomal alpha-N-acetyl glucosaminidase [Paratrimastix pyriformis]|uniref:Lysosomal alpha-N-acetyl glucosaminidase n=1 Tax=Paratrimastix pyriformis TaxID=342808 RepID=A0ABQ8US85_9EUKA|nr:putative lysosomal alpha-N-acetyl glucosaminidase [Paratrimastix pyriformis]
MIRHRDSVGIPSPPLRPPPLAASRAVGAAPAGTTQALLPGSQRPAAGGVADRIPHVGLPAGEAPGVSRRQTPNDEDAVETAARQIEGLLERLEAERREHRVRQEALQARLAALEMAAAPREAPLAPPDQPSRIPAPPRPSPGGPQMQRDLAASLEARLRLDEQLRDREGRLSELQGRLAHATALARAQRRVIEGQQDHIQMLMKALLRAGVDPAPLLAEHQRILGFLDEALPSPRQYAALLGGDAAPAAVAHAPQGTPTDPPVARAWQPNVGSDHPPEAAPDTAHGPQPSPAIAELAQPALLPPPQPSQTLAAEAPVSSAPPATLLPHTPGRTAGALFSPIAPAPSPARRPIIPRLPVQRPSPPAHPPGQSSREPGAERLLPPDWSPATGLPPRHSTPPVPSALYNRVFYLLSTVAGGLFADKTDILTSFASRPLGDSSGCGGCSQTRSDRLMARALFVALLFAAAVLAAPDDAVKGLIARLLPKHTQLFQLEIIPAEGSNDVFEVAGAGSSVILRGNNGIALASALKHYLANFCNCSVSWFGDNLQIPAPTPIPAKVTRVVTPYKYRYYFNTCTFGYSMVWWDWARWEREIDWMALNGINAPLAFTGQEQVWAQTYKAFGVTDQEVLQWLTGPAFLPWQRMGNVDGWAGPLPDSWLSGQVILQQKILARERSFGMRPILPAFAGHVPAGLQRAQPTAKITQLKPWTEGFVGTFLLSSEDPLFAKIGTTFIRQQAALFGTDHLYNCDLFNEVMPPTKDPAYLRALSGAVMAAMQAADPLAIWVMQGWFLVYSPDPTFWDLDTACAFLSGVPHERLLMLDLYSEVHPSHKAPPTEWRTPPPPELGNRVSSVVLSVAVGGRCLCPGGSAQEHVAQLRRAARPLRQHGSRRRGARSHRPRHLVHGGVGLTPEAIEQNPMVYELMVDTMPMLHPALTTRLLAAPPAIWCGHRRAAAQQAWKLIRRSAYQCQNGQSGPSGSIFGARPGLALTSAGCCGPLELFYDAALVDQAWGLLVGAAAQLGKAATFRYDLVEVGSTALSNLAMTVYSRMRTAYEARNLAAFDAAASTFQVCPAWGMQTSIDRPSAGGAGLAQGMLADMDALLASDRYWLAGTWTNASRAWGASPAEQDLMEYNARRQITLWGVDVCLTHGWCRLPSSGLSGYAYKSWAGLVKGFYGPRWQAFITGVHNALAKGTSFDEGAFQLQMMTWESAWTRSTDPLPVTPVGDTALLSQKIFAKYH